MCKVNWSSYDVIRSCCDVIICFTFIEVYSCGVIRGVTSIEVVVNVEVVVISLEVVVTSLEVVVASLDVL